MKSQEQSASPAAATQLPYALPVLKCEGIPFFRSRAARDLGCILDLEPSIQSWQTRPVVSESDVHPPDFKARDIGGVIWLFDAPDHPQARDQRRARLAESAGFRHRVFDRAEIYGGFRLRNARDLLRYANFTPTLSERLRVLSVLDEQGSLRMAECLQVVGGRDPVAAVASLTLHGHLEMELDEALIGPETMVKRIRT